MDLIHGREEQRRERQHPDATRARAAPNPSKGCCNVNASFRRFAGDEIESTVADIEKRRRCRCTIGELLERHPGAIGQIKDGAVDKADAYLAAGGGLYNVTSINGVAKFDLYRILRRSRKGARTNNDFYCANSKGRRGRRL